MRDSPIQTFHYKVVVIVVGPHKEGAHDAFYSQSIIKHLGEFFLIVFRIGNEVNGDSHVQIVCYFVLM